MQHLFAGNQSQERLEVLLRFTSIGSEGIKDAISDHLVKGLPISLAASLNDVRQCNLTKALIRLNEVAANVVEAENLDWAKFKGDYEKVIEELENQLSDII